MKVGGTDEMYRKENWETHRKLVYGSSKCYTTDVKQQKPMIGDLCRNMLMETLYNLNHSIITNILLQDNSHKYYKDTLSQTLLFNTANIKMKMYAFKI